MNTNEFHRTYLPAVKNVFDLPRSYYHDGLNWRDDGFAKRLQRVFSYPIFDGWLGREISEERPLTARQKYLLEAMAGPHGRTVYLALCVRREIEP